ncbi:tripartite motif-containing protein 2-like [Littorina saxatilis]|uniref:Uncharacterized protein n=1 Tax=Littorina saxatilis TaxID=31220 RepID=A0AAN9AXJ8_9CAEN
MATAVHISGTMLHAEEGVMEEISEVIPREFLNCRLCNEEFQDPKLLPCLHSFCRRCLADYIPARKPHHPDDHHQAKEEGTFSCPECGTEVVAEDLGSLPDNVLARRLSCPSLTSTPREAATCASCGQQGRGEVQAAVHCANCDENLCASCANAHDLEVETASHKVEPLKSAAAEEMKDCKGGEGGEGGDMAKSDSADNVTAVNKCCQCYDTYDIDSMFCVDCDLALCADCHATHDQSHRCAELSAIAQNFTSKIQEPVEDLRKDSQTLTRRLTNLDRAERYAAKLQRDVQTKVRRRTRVLCGLIREYESVLLQEIERRNQQSMDAIQQRRLATSQHAASITAVTELTDKLLQFGSEEEKVALRRKVGRRVRELCETDLPSDPLELTNLRLHEPSVTVETICNLFGELRTDLVHPGVRRRVLTSSQSFDSSHNSFSESVDDNMTELTELDEEEEGEGEGEEGKDSESSMLSNSDRSEILKAERRKAEQVNGSEAKAEHRRRRHSHSGLSLDRFARPNNKGFNGLEMRSYSLDKDSSLDSSATTGEEKTDTFNSSLQSTGSAQDNIPTQLLETARKELVLPDLIARDNIKGVGVNSHGDIIIATIATAGGSSKSAIYVLEQHGIVRGQIPVAANWNVHCVGPDGRVVLIIARGDNRFKVKVMCEDGTGAVLTDVHLESFGLNFATATASGQLLVASNRYAKLSSLSGKAAKSGGNVAVYDSEGRLENRFTNEDLSPKGAHLLEKPHWLAMDNEGNIFVADPATHCVVGFTMAGKLLFGLGNSDMESEDLYQGPDSVCVDRLGHVVVTDKKEGRIDVINYQGKLLKSLFPSDPIKFVCTTPDKLLLVVPTEGSLKFYDYL